VGDYVADLLVEGSVIIELKAVKALDDIHTAQCLNYLRATNLRLCLLLNFGPPTLEVRRAIHGFDPCSSVFICGFRLPGPPR
jgi:GxxExxY protein